MMFINIPRLTQIREQKRKDEELERFFRELVGKMNEELDEVRAAIIKEEKKK